MLNVMIKALLQNGGTVKGAAAPHRLREDKPLHHELHPDERHLAVSLQLLIASFAFGTAGSVSLASPSDPASAAAPPASAAAPASSSFARATSACPSASTPVRQKPPTPRAPTSAPLVPSDASGDRLWATCGSVNVSQEIHGSLSRSKDEDKNCSQWVELLGKALWPIVVLIGLLAFRRPIIGVLTSRDVDFEWGEKKLRLRSLSESQERAKKEQELAEDAAAPGPDLVARPSPGVNRLSRGYQSEDLALRELQTDFGVPIQRQVTGGKDSGFDGFFELGKQRNIVEVRYFRNSFLPDKLNAGLRGIVAAANAYGWKNARIILVAVFEELRDREDKVRKLQRAVADVGLPVVVRVRTFAELQAQFSEPPTASR